MSVFRLPSDVGGMRLGDPVNREEHDHAEWELLSAGVRMALIARGLFRWDEGRRAIEELGVERYNSLSYEARKVAAIERLVQEKGVLREGVPPRRQDSRAAEHTATLAEAHRRVHEASRVPRFAVGDHVRIRNDWPRGHVRTPAYLRGRPGRVVGVHGPFLNPETLAYGDTGLPAQWLYTVALRQADVWDDYSGEAADLLMADIYQHWVEALEEAS